MSGPDRRTIDRRSLLSAAAWSAPVVALAIAAPAAAASARPAPAAPATWEFRGDNDGYNNAYYEIKKQLWRIPPYPLNSGGQPDQNLPFIGSVQFRFTLIVDNGPSGANGGFAIGNGTGFSLSTTDLQRGWTVASTGTAGDGRTTIVLSNSSFSGFGQGSAPYDSVRFQISTTSPGQNNWPRNGSSYISALLEGLPATSQSERFTSFGPYLLGNGTLAS
jgi:hypothetical protein